MNFLINLFFAALSAFIGAFLAISHDNNKRPNLKIKLGEHADSQDKKHRFLHLNIVNEMRTSWWGRFIKGNLPARNCKVQIQFLDIDTKSELFSIQGRWSSTPEPGIPTIQPNQIFFDPARAMFGETENIMPSEIKPLSICLKFDGEKEFVGFNNWSYMYNSWKNPSWILSGEKTLIRIHLTWDSGKMSQDFFIINPNSTITNFKIAN